MKIKLASDLEKALLRSIAEGVCSPDIVAAEELSKTARQVYESIEYLLKKKAEPPLKASSILLTAEALFGVEKETFKAYLKTFKDFEVGREVSSIVRSAREKTLLVRLINEAGTQLSKGHLDVREIARLLEKTDAHDAIQALAHSVETSFPTPPKGIPIQSLPLLSRAANGLIGLWIIGGEPGLGKSTLAFQLGLDAGGAVPVVYYDLDGTGHEWLLDRVRCIAKGSIKQFKKLTRRFYLRESIGSLDEDISFVRKEYGNGPAVLIIDSLQALPTTIKYKKEGLDSWLLRFKGLSKKGFVIICVSEQNRAHYGEPTMGGFKGSGDIEYAGTLCMQLLQDEDADSDDPVKVHVVKNRHGKRKGHIIDLIRDEDKEFWFEEEEA